MKFLLILINPESFSIFLILASRPSLERVCLRLSTFIGKLSGVKDLECFRIISDFSIL
jgi:hypothetical protein